MSENHFQDVKDFHIKFGQLVGEQPQHLTARKLRERIEFMLEELSEFCDAAGFQLKFDLREVDEVQDLSGQADALVDLVYVALGTAVMQGLPWQPLWDDVQRANMAKERGTTHRGYAFDVTKPPGWQPPMTYAILGQHNYDVQRWIPAVDLGGGRHIAQFNVKECVDDPQPNE